MNKKKLIKFNFIKTKIQRNNHIHFIGIGGYGMGGIAKILINEGYYITGSDIMPNLITEYLSTLGAKIYFNHDYKNINYANVVVISSAISNNNPELIYARKQNIPIISRGEMLAELMRVCYGIAIAGTHGKTTTTAMLASIYIESGLDPSFVNGCIAKTGIIQANSGNSNYFIAEADESDASFLYLKPIVAVVTNIEYDHMDTYQGKLEKLKQAFIDFLHNVPFYGYTVVCLDDTVIRDLIPQINRSITTYGFSKHADLRIENYVQSGMKSYFRLTIKDHICLKISLNAPGRHNALNAVAAIAVSYNEGVSEKSIINGLKYFKGTKRRFDFLGKFPTKSLDGNIGNTILIDDYGHHPTEIEATIRAIRLGWPSRKLLMIFQPHRYTRTRDMLNSFANVLSKADILFILDVYAAGEQKITGADSNALCNAIQKIGKLNPTLIKKPEFILDVLAKYISGNDVVLTQGAGNIGQIAINLAYSKLKTI
ncbi:UDP-N-acetylmuramate--L-alanine ligase [Candidatus Pantoea edessiphila]|uniref:UDP-N-acetylmuramate--L-alanine ligase n=1 Tax=Candidatus Pantoea edessiphila TaxID=2044610 RepID=A0A2P5SY62_9GAMM|nr:UDP-N-acetylmuramate--L-alanine ligase [Candidatus Pantoea edessiphila]MBK4775589.1 UDP-N-acetylmuramate--L-alanine ligase [Pantoea sp. Edef]PPI87240.1 UDP-N-acetylmuramate--L-alanine ligase [Candidatus Pantoea edessiphila]